MDRISLRPERSEDEPFLHRLYASTRAEEMARVPWQSAQKDAFLRMQFESQTLHYRRYYRDAAFQIILLEGRPVGRLYLNRGDTEIRVIDIALLPEYRGAGIGGGLLRGLLSEAAAAGKPVTMHVERRNPALRLYRRLRFRLVEDKGIYLFMEWRPGGSDPHCDAPASRDRPLAADENRADLLSGRA